MNIEEKESIEIEFWKDSREENPDVFSVPNLINKMKEAEIFLDKLSNYSQIFRKSKDILELGGGQGWASSMVKAYYPNARITLSDISEYAVRSLPKWEKVFNCKVDQSLACRSYQTPLKGESYDLIFCFASAHHFVKQKETLQELKRLLKPGGYALYLHEPSCKKYIYSLAKKRVNNKRTEVPEDLLIGSELIKNAAEEGLEIQLNYAPTTKNRSLSGSLYYAVLSKISFLQRLLPCTIDVVMHKK